MAQEDNFNPLRAHIWRFIWNAGLWWLYNSSAPYKSQSKSKGHLLYPNDSPSVPQNFLLIPNVFDSRSLKLDLKRRTMTFSQLCGIPINLTYSLMVGQISTMSNLNILFFVSHLSTMIWSSSDWSQHQIKSMNSQIHDFWINLNP